MRLLSPLHIRLLRYLQRYLFPYVLLATVAMLLVSGTEGLTIIIIRNFTNQLTLARSLRELPLYCCIMLGIFLIRALATFGSDFLEAYVMQNITLEIRAELNEALQQQSLAFFNRTPSGVMMARVMNDVAGVSGGAIDSVFALFSGTTRLLAVLAGAFYVDWRFALAAFVVFPSAVLPVIRFSKEIRRMTKDAQRQLSGLMVLLQETYQGNRIVKAFGMEDYERARFRRELRRLYRISMRVARIRSVTGPMIEVMGAFAIVAVIWWGAHSVMAGSRTPGVFVAFIGAMLLLYRPFKTVTRTNNSLQAGLAAAERVFGMMDAPREVVDAPNALTVAPGAHHITFEHVWFRYAKDWVLHDINLEIRPGQVVALVGMSGGGKSTIADMIPRFYDVQQGRVAIDGVDVRRLRLASLRAQIGLVTQHTFLFNDTIRANIAYGSVDKTPEEIEAAALAANAHNFIARLPQGYDTRVGESGVRLSGGERQRIAIARALLKNAPILVLDEATSSLDSEAERLVQQALERLMEHRTTLVIAHRLSTVHRADRIYVIVGGRVAEEGTHGELVALGGEYNRLHELQFLSPAAIGSNGGLAN
jgi:ATP-binding cassette, subfamily B, bacterial MsbA